MTNLIIHTESSLGWGGQEIRVFRELVGMRSHGYRTALIAPKNSTLFLRSQKAGIEVYHADMKSKLDPRSWWRIFCLLRSLKPGLINTHSSEDSWLAGALGRALGIYVIRTRHVSTPVGSLFSYNNFSNLIFTTSDAISANFTQDGLPAEKIITLPTGIDCSAYAFSQKARANIRKELQIDTKHVLVGNVCVFRSWKGLDFFLETAAELPGNFRFLLVGDGPQKERLIKKSENMGMKDKVLFVGHKENVEDYFSAMDVLFYTSYASEGVPQSLLQGVSSGLPVTAVDLSSIREALRGIEGSSWVTYGDIKGAVGSIQQMAHLFSQERRGEVPQAWRDHHSLQKMLQNIDAIYQQQCFKSVSQ